MLETVCAGTSGWCQVRWGSVRSERQTFVDDGADAYRNINRLIAAMGPDLKQEVMAGAAVGAPSTVDTLVQQDFDEMILRCMKPKRPWTPVCISCAVSVTTSPSRCSNFTTPLASIPMAFNILNKEKNEKNEIFSRIPRRHRLE